MNTIAIILSSASGLMLVSTLICGFWIRAQGSTPESLGFHAKFAVATSLVTASALVVLLSLAF